MKTKSNQTSLLSRFAQFLILVMVASTAGCSHAHLKIDGSSGTAYQGTVQIGNQVKTISGSVPGSHSWNSDKISFDIRKTSPGKLLLSLDKKGAFIPQIKVEENQNGVRGEWIGGTFRFTHY